MQSRKLYALKIVIISLVFIPVDLALLILLGYQMTWQVVAIVIGMLAVGDLLLIALTGKTNTKARPKTKAAKATR